MVFTVQLNLCYWVVCSHCNTGCWIMYNLQLTVHVVTLVWCVCLCDVQCSSCIICILPAVICDLEASLSNLLCVDSNGLLSKLQSITTLSHHVIHVCLWCWASTNISTNTNNWSDCAACIWRSHTCTCTCRTLHVHQLVYCIYPFCQIPRQFAHACTYTMWKVTMVWQ